MGFSDQRFLGRSHAQAIDAKLQHIGSAMTSGRAAEVFANQAIQRSCTSLSFV